LRDAIGEDELAASVVEKACPSIKKYVDEPSNVISLETMSITYHFHRVHGAEVSAAHLIVGMPSS
jgi:hypothetical protein